jgi:tRNA threonylcarbamoyladenosine biosynthesis protein TsaE
MNKLSVKVNSLGQTGKLAEQIVNNLKGGEVICLIGDLGVGKTYFVKFFAEAMGISSDDIISPTFVYWRKHKGDKFKLNHFDFYRINKEEEAKGIGIEDAFSEKEAVTIIEWADRIESTLPKDRLEIHIKYLGQTEREVELSITGKTHEHLLKGVEIEEDK